MNSTIENFTQKLEELKKRLKAISTSQNVLSKLNALQDYFSQIQDYLNAINTSFSEHITESEDYSTSINTLQTQLEEIQQQIQNLPNLNDFNLPQMQADIATLQNDLSTLKGTSNSSISNLEAQIATIQADISTITAQISTLQSNISKNSSDISTLKSTTQNHSTTLTNLTSTQNTLTNTVNNINNRLSSAESELSAITGGIDLTELDARVDDLEKMSPTLTLVDSKKIIINKTYNNVSDYLLRNIMFGGSPNGKLYARVKIEYSSSTNLKHTFGINVNGNYASSETINTNNYPSEYQTDIFYNCFDNSVVFALKLTTVNQIKIKSIKIDIFCKNANYIEYDPEIYVSCFNNEIYITKKTDNSYKFGKFTPENVSITEFPYEIIYDFNDKINRLFYVPKTTGENDVYQSYEDSIVTYDSDSIIRRYTNIDETMSNLSLQVQETYNYFYSNPVPSYFDDFSHMFVRVDTIYFQRIFNSTSTIFLGSNGLVKNDKWTFCAPIINNYQTLGSTHKNLNTIDGVCLNVDGYFYYLKHSKQVLKLGRGIYASAYLQQDGTINAYITNENKITCYVIADDNGTPYIKSKRTQMYKIIYEILGGKRITWDGQVWRIKNS